MSAADYFVAEARECLDELASLLDRDAEPARLRVPARRLRGSAQMASREQSLRVASALEGAVRAAEDGRVAWDAGARGAIAQAISQLGGILENESVAGAEQALARLRGLGETVVQTAVPRPGAGSRADGFADFARRERERIQGALEGAAAAAGAARPDPAPLQALLDAQATLAGSARLGELPVAARAIETADHLARALLAGAAGGDAWAAALREVADVLTTGEAQGEDRDAQLARLDRAAAVAAGRGGAEAEVPVEVANFFRSEARAELARAEQLARDAAQGRIATAADRLAAVLASLANTAATFGFADVGKTLEGARSVIAATPDAELPAAVANLSDAVLSALGQPAARGAGARPGWGGPAPIITAGAEGDIEGAAEAPAGVARATPAAPPAPGPAPGSAATGVASASPGALPAPDAEGAVPIAALCYAGEAALRRAAELRSRWEEARGDEARAIVEELFDLIELARA